MYTSISSYDGRVHTSNRNMVVFERFEHLLKPVSASPR